MGVVAVVGRAQGMVCVAGGAAGAARVFAWFLKRGSPKNEENHENDFVLCDAVA